ncbi:MAG: sigma-70 family RNA polymerase sigma factor [Bacilli bacterium]|nr:sigma-70 family RNA polymerase sigma factor [Bacilli bacterium]
MRNISEEEFELKYNSYKPIIFNIAYSYLKNVNDCDDLVQDVFMKYLGSDEKFDTLDNEKYWLIRVTINSCINKYNNSLNKVIVNDDYVNNYVNNESIKEESNDSKNEMFELICSLPTKYKNIIILFYYDDLKIKEISHILNISEANVKKRLERARNMLRNKIKKED